MLRVWALFLSSVKLVSWFRLFRGYTNTETSSFDFIPNSTLFSFLLSICICCVGIFDSLAVSVGRLSWWEDTGVCDILAIDHSHLIKEFSDLSDRLDFFYIFKLPIKESLCNLLNFILLLWSILVIIYSLLVGKRIMHSQLLLQIPYFPLILLQQHTRILMHILKRLITHIHHSSRKLKRRNTLLNMIRLRPHIRNHQCFTVPPNRVLQQERQQGLPVWHMCSLLITHSDHDLF